MKSIPRFVFPRGTVTSASQLKAQFGIFMGAATPARPITNIPFQRDSNGRPSIDLGVYGLRFTTVPTDSDLAALAKDSPAIRDIGQAVLRLRPTDDVSLYTPGISHFYITMSQARILTNPQHAVDLGYKLSRLFWSMFPNGVKEGFAHGRNRKSE